MRGRLLSLFFLVLPGIVRADFCDQPAWQDEFDHPALDVSKWRAVSGDGCDQSICGWGNDELQWYSTDNLSVVDGVLKIVARREADKTKPFTSAKITSENLFAQKYGRFEARMKLPATPGTWPAFWLMPQNREALWPIEGEIDILERGGRDDTDMHRILGAIHFGTPWPGNVHYSESLTVPDSWSDDFHTYRVEWKPGVIRWSVDSKVYGEVTPAEIRPHRWPFDDKPFYLILNLALGGTLGGEVSEQFKSAALEVDFVRVYRLCD